MRSNAILLPLLGSSVGTVSAITTQAAKGKPTVPGAYLVEFEDSHDAGTFYGNLSATDIQVSTTLNLTYTLFHGASFKLNDLANEDEAVAQITSMTAVKQLWPVRLHTLSPTEKVQTSRSPIVASSSTLRRRDSEDTWSPHVMTQVDQLRALGITGEGVKLAIIDTGVDYYHPALGGGFGEGYLVSFGYDLVGDDYDGSNTPVPDPDPLDQCQGHGTHVAGIIAAQPNEYNFTGAAPDVTLGMYRVFGCYDSVGDDVLIDAYNMAYEAGSDIITASIGGDNGWSEEAWAVAVSRIVQAGVPCPVAAGNEGEYGVFYASGAADGKEVTSVASFDNWEYPALLYEASYSISNASGVTFGWTAGSPPFGNVSLPLWATSNISTNAADACEALPADTPDLSGYIVLIQRGTCTFVAKATNAAAYGAQYVMFYANTGAVVSTDISSVSQILGVGMVSEEQGAAWVEDLNAGEDVYLTIIDPDYAELIFEQGTNDVTGGFASTYTSWGPTWDLDVYPLVAAPGGNIFSTYLTNEGSYAVLSGTSMATPLVAAIYALVGQVRGTFDPTTLRNVLTTTSKANLWNDGSTTYDALAPVPQQGPGLVQAYDAAFSATLLTPATISFNDTDHFVSSTDFTIENTGSETVTYTIGHVPALTVYTLDGSGDLYPAYFPNPTDSASATLSFSSSSIDVPAGSAVNISVSPTPPTTLDASLLPVYSGYITINGTDASNYTIPYLGVLGSMTNATNLDPTYTYLFTSTDTSYTPASADTTFTVPYPTLAEAVSPSTNISYPTALFQLDLGSALLRIDVLPLATNYTGTTTTVLGQDIAGSVYGFPSEWLTRYAWTGVFTGLLADGTVVPEGAYKLIVRALRIFGDREVEEGYESIETVAFNLVYA